MSGDDGEGNSEHRSENEAQHSNQRSIWAAWNSVSRPQRIIAELAVLALYFIFEGHSVWPESHGWALLQGAGGACVVLAIEMPLKWWIPTSGIIAIATAIAYVAVGPNLPAETETHGWLFPANEPTPENGCTTDKSNIPAKLRVPPPGTLLFIAGTNAIWKTTEGKQPIFSHDVFLLG